MLQVILQPLCIVNKAKFIEDIELKDCRVPKDEEK